LEFIRFITYEIKSPIENVVKIVQTMKAMIAGIIIKNFSLSAVNPIIMQNVAHIIKFTITEYLKEVKISELPLLIFLYANFPPIHKAIKKETTSPIVEIP